MSIMWRCVCAHQNFLHWESCALCGGARPQAAPEAKAKTGMGGTGNNSTGGLGGSGNTKSKPADDANTGGYGGGDYSG